MNERSRGTSRTRESRYRPDGLASSASGRRTRTACGTAAARSSSTSWRACESVRGLEGRRPPADRNEWWRRRRREGVRTSARLGPERPTDRPNERLMLAGPGAPGRLERERTATWLILPVVICLSQRLSHACLSTYLDTVKPRMAH